MEIEAAIYSELKNNSGVSALVGTRIYPKKLPQNSTFPALIYQQVGGGSIYSHSGASALATPVWQVSCFASTFTGAKNLARKVREALQGFSGTLGGAGGVSTGGIFKRNEIDLYDDETQIYQTVLDFNMMHVESN